MSLSLPTRPVDPAQDGAEPAPAEPATVLLLPEPRPATGPERGPARPVFVDATGRRLRRLRRVGALVGLSCVGYLVVLAAAVGGGVVDPVTSGLPLSDAVAPLVADPTTTAATTTRATTTRATATRAATTTRATARSTVAPVAVPVASAPATTTAAAVPTTAAAVPTTAAPATTTGATTSAPATEDTTTEDPATATSAPSETGAAEETTTGLAEGDATAAGAEGDAS